MSLTLVRVRVKDMPPPKEPHRIVECDQCKERCYSLGDSDKDVLMYRGTIYKCVRCYYSADRQLLEAIMDGVNSRN